LTYAAVYLGIATGAFQEVRHHVMQRAPRLAQIESVQRHFGEMAVSIERTSSLVHRAAALFDEHGPEGQNLYMSASLAADETAVEVTERAMLVGGGVAYAKGNQLERYLRDAFAGPVMVPQDDLTKLALGRSYLEP
jgi:alkylation response protein AidB-like acyl-CoA dehydrogenase